MDLDQIKNSLPELERRLVEVDERASAALIRARDAEAEAQSAIAERDSLLKIIEGIRGLMTKDGAHANSVPSEHRKKIRGREAVRRVLREHGRPMRQRDIVSEVVARGWVDPEAKQPAESIRIAVRRLADDDEVEKVSDGVYRYKIIADHDEGEETG